MTIVLKFPLTSAASTKGLHRYRGFCPAGDGGGRGRGNPGFSNVVEVGVVGERRGLRGWRPIERLPSISILTTLADPRDSKPIDTPNGIEERHLRAVNRFALLQICKVPRKTDEYRILTEPAAEEIAVLCIATKGVEVEARQSSRVTTIMSLVSHG